MCFTKYQKTKPRIRIAEKNIVCWKYAKIDDNLKGNFIPQYYYSTGIRYRIGKVAHACDESGNKIKDMKIIFRPLPSKPSKTNVWVVEEGIHSYESNKYYLNHHNTVSIAHNHALLKCVIPKGTKYLKNTLEEVGGCKDDIEYVSLKIKPIKAYKNGDIINEK